MTISDEKYAALLARIYKLEQAYNDLVTAFPRLATTTQLNQLLMTISTDLETVQTEVASLQTRVEEIEAEPIR